MTPGAQLFLAFVAPSYLLLFAWSVADWLKGS